MLFISILYLYKENTMVYSNMCNSEFKCQFWTGPARDAIQRIM